MRAKTRLLVSVGGPLAALSVSLFLVPTTHRPVSAPAAVAASVEESAPPVWRHPLPASARPIPPAPPTTVTVVPGDTLAGIAARLSRTWQQLAGWNHLSWLQAQTITVGQVLAVPPSGYVPPYTPPPPAPIRPAVLAAVSRPYAPAPAYTGPLPAGIYSFAALESLWVQAGGPSWAAPRAARIAQCESGGNPSAHNRSGATGLWQILGAVVAGNLYDPAVNAENAVAKFRDAGNSFSPWVCQ